MLASTHVLPDGTVQPLLPSLQPQSEASPAKMMMRYQIVSGAHPETQLAHLAGTRMQTMQLSLLEAELQRAAQKGEAGSAM